MKNSSNKINMIRDDYEPKTKTEYDKKKTISWYFIRNFMQFQFFAFVSWKYFQTENHQLQRLDKVLRKYSKGSKPVGEMEKERSDEGINDQYL